MMCRYAGENLRIPSAQNIVHPHIHSPSSTLALSSLEQYFIKHECFQHVAVDVDGLSTFDLVWLARGSLDRGDLDQAVRYVSMLK